MFVFGTKLRRNMSVVRFGKNKYIGTTFIFLFRHVHLENCWMVKSGTQYTR
jgi:hypothetical protein